MNGTLAKSFRSSSRPVVDVLNPFSGASVGKVEVADEVAVADALRAARKAWRFFRFSTPAERKGLLHRLAKLLAEDAEEMAQIICAEVGKLARSLATARRRPLAKPISQAGWLAALRVLTVALTAADSGMRWRKSN